MNFPSRHPLHLGFNPDGLIQEADAVLVVECPTPWFHDVCKPPASARVIHLGRDPHFSRYVMRSYPADAVLAGDPAAGLRSLQAALASRLAGKGEAVERRRARCALTHQRQRAAWAEEVERARAARPIDPRWLSACISQVLDGDTILLNEYVLDIRPSELKVPGTYFRSSHAGGLGWALGASLGAKLARPEKTVLAVVGDGTYIYNAPTSAHFVSRAQGLPCLTVILNNRMWNAVRTAVRYLYPGGVSCSRDEYPLSRLEPAPDYEKIVEASGGYGERVEDPGGLLPALRRAIQVVRGEGRQAVLNVICQAI
ncbi:MAG: hypothetical protein HYY66_04825 [Candidatus Tectomicrobia bacterium]|nr:hypothetical protein [Candidatus Tectomicrobia bacterium]